MTGRRAVVKEPVVIPPVIVITVVFVPFYCNCCYSLALLLLRWTPFASGGPVLPLRTFATNEASPLLGTALPGDIPGNTSPIVTAGIFYATPGPLPSRPFTVMLASLEPSPVCFLFLELCLSHFCAVPSPLVLWKFILYPHRALTVVG
jgi:hypothetical protein